MENHELKSIKIITSRIAEVADELNYKLDKLLFLFKLGLLIFSVFLFLKLFLVNFSL